MIYSNVCEYAKKRSKTIAQIEREAGLANGTIGKWHTGSVPSVASLQAVANVLKVKVDTLLKENG